MAKWIITKDPKYGIVTGQQIQDPRVIDEWLRPPRRRIQEEPVCDKCKRRLYEALTHNCPPTAA